MGFVSDGGGGEVCGGAGKRLEVGREEQLSLGPGKGVTGE